MKGSISVSNSAMLEPVNNSAEYKLALLLGATESGIRGKILISEAKGDTRRAALLKDLIRPGVSPADKERTALLIVGEEEFKP